MIGKGIEIGWRRVTCTNQLLVVVGGVVTDDTGLENLGRRRHEVLFTGGELPQFGGAVMEAQLAVLVAAHGH